MDSSPKYALYGSLAQITLYYSTDNFYAASYWPSEFPMFGRYGDIYKCYNVRNLCVGFRTISVVPAVQHTRSAPKTKENTKVDPMQSS